ncbi:MAG: PD-(D/E)XK nuclease family protein [Bacteroidales bacterium]|nr:PD-(D/E)XK nuclease family protein [Bacteroidales bacterium]
MEDYNIFEVLKLERKETIHSAMIAAIVAQDEICRESFFRMLKTKGYEEQIEKLQSSIDYDDVDHKWIDTEVNLKEYVYRNEEKMLVNRGRADIWVGTNSEDYTPKYRLIIENKIDADNQDHQLRRYYRYLTGISSKDTDNKREFAGLFFLCINGDDDDKAKAAESAKKYPTESKDINGEERPNTDYKIITYSDIKLWLEKIINDYNTKEGNFKEAVKQYKKMIEEKVLK